MLQIWTIGHSRHAAGTFLELLRCHATVLLADVRRQPFSRRHPQFSKPVLTPVLAEAGIRYRHFAALGGRRQPGQEDRNAGLGEPGMRGYADWANGREFQAALDELCRLAADQPTAVMCAEADPARCHRLILADHLLARGFEVVHILADGRTKRHELHGAAQVLPGGAVVYPARQAELFECRLKPPAAAGGRAP